MRRHFPLTSGLIILGVILSSFGCSGEEGLGGRYTVSGKVTYNGEPVKKGKINFVPQDATKRGGTGEIEDGQIVNVTTLTAGDGLLPGTYKVAISAAEDVDISNVTKKYRASPDPVTVSKAQAKAKSLIPPKYANAIDSGLTAEVSSSQRSFEFNLKD